MITQYIDAGTTCRLDTTDGWTISPRPDEWLAGGFNGIVTTNYHTGPTDVQGPVVAFYRPAGSRGKDTIPPRPGKPAEMQCFTVNGYGPRLSRTVWQAPRMGTLRVGLTVNNPGAWSSFPPHGFERGPAPDGFLEYFFVMVRRSHDQANKFWLPGALIVRGSSPGLLSPCLVRDGDIIGVPAGIHAITALPGAAVAYLWAYTADTLPEKIIDPTFGRYEEDR